MLADIANTVAVHPSIDLHMSIFVTRACDPTETVPSIPNCDVTMKARPSIYGLLHDLTSARGASSSPVAGSIEADGAGRYSLGRIKPSGHVGGVAVCASGPASLTTEAQNAVARLGVVRGIGAAIHVERFTL